MARLGRQRYDADELSRGGAGRTSPDLAKSDAQGSNSTRVLVRGGVRDMRNPPRATAGSAGVGAWCAAAEAALRWRISPAQAVGRRQCSGLGITGSVSMRKVSAGQNKGRAWPCCAVVRSATADLQWVQRRGTGVRCSGPWGLLQATKAGLKGRGEGGEAHRGSTRKMARCRGVDGDVRR